MAAGEPRPRADRGRRRPGRARPAGQPLPAGLGALLAAPQRGRPVPAQRRARARRSASRSRRRAGPAGWPTRRSARAHLAWATTATSPRSIPTGRSRRRPPRPAPGWQSVQLDGAMLRIPAGIAARSRRHGQGPGIRPRGPGGHVRHRPSGRRAGQPGRRHRHRRDHRRATAGRSRWPTPDQPARPGQRRRPAGPAAGGRGRHLVDQLPHLAAGRAGPAPHRGSRGPGFPRTGPGRWRAWPRPPAPTPTPPPPRRRRRRRGPGMAAPQRASRPGLAEPRDGNVRGTSADGPKPMAAQVGRSRRERTSTAGAVRSAAGAR